MGIAQYEKRDNPKYDQNDFLDELIKKEIPGSDIKGDVVIIGEYAFELDRSIPAIKRDLGKEENLVFPELTVTAKLIENNKKAEISITAKEEENGIEKIEIWILGEKIKEYTYDKVKTEIKIAPPYTATQNGEYTIKVYSDLWTSKTVKVEGIVASVEFEPNGSEEWKKAHSTRVTIKETNERITNAKYYWSESVDTPSDEKFTVNFNSGDTITKDGVTGTYYLWTMLETSSGNVKWRSEGFNFDNEGPEVTLASSSMTETGFTLTATANDRYTDISRYEFYANNTLVPSTATSNICEVNLGKMAENVKCEVVAYDSLGNTNRAEITARTKLHTWSVWNADENGYERVLTFSNELTDLSGSNWYDGTYASSVRTGISDIASYLKPGGYNKGPISPARN